LHAHSNYAVALQARGLTLAQPTEKEEHVCSSGAGTGAPVFASLA
jgi:hypothetical protein